MIRKTIISFIIAFISIYVTSCNFSEKKETEDNYTLKAELISGIPEKLNKGLNDIKNQMNLSDFKYSSLKTGIDTLDIYFGRMKQAYREGYWVSAYNTNDSAWTWSTVSLKNSDTLKFPANNIELKLGDSKNPKRISLKIIHNTKENSIIYTWLCNGKKSKKACLSEVTLPIQINKPFPELELELLNKDTLNTKELADKYVVINWWNTGCKPCIAGMPKLNGLVEKYKTSNVLFLSIAFDKKEKVENLLKKKEFNFTHALGNKKAAEIFGQSYPQYVILNPEGKVIYFKSGGSEQRYEQIDRILSNKIG